MSRILVCDDEQTMRAFVARALEMDGHFVTQAEDGAHALEIMAASEPGFDLLLTDIRMPVMDGIALALNAARDHPRTAILLMTGFADQRERASDLDAIIHDVVTKPFSLADIRQKAGEAIAAGRPVVAA
ncbi:response regulator [Labrys wisconsinensis]|uniref:CheY-like chemotaxis protein n=1 Tax=Labrys wisconsinensis TaxID=425677 RepID=A0ABU0JPT1_9HYPH|nr:response regulator [Labrys wisconsinensis]MDQ0475157.1 CheY-like chemotaxis protein [Labrys wisconsinensis]